MAQVHKASINMLEVFLAKLTTIKYSRALDVGAGDGRVTKDLLHRLFAAVDLLEPYKDYIDKIKQVKPVLPRLEHVDHAKMQEYQWKEMYSLILLFWCSGYVDDEELESFLKSAKQHLVQEAKRATRKSGRTAFIVVFDNISNAGDGTLWREGQRIREEATFAKIFSRANLTIWEEEPLAVLEDNDFPVKMWALY